MGAITAYKCDVCGKISEEPLQFTISMSFIKDKPMSCFKITPGPTLSYEDGACSIDCLVLELKRWAVATNLKRQQEDREDDEVDLVELPTKILGPVEA